MCSLRSWSLGYDNNDNDDDDDDDDDINSNDNEYDTNGFIQR